MRRTSVLLFTLLLLLLACLASNAFAQKVSGTITGVVTDPSGAVVPGAAVTVINEATNASRTASTNAEGSFTVPQLDPGSYTVSVTHEGFKQVTQRGVALHVSDVTALNVKMSVGSRTEAVNVESSQVQVETQTGEVGNIIEGEQVRELPLNGRNFVQLTTLVPGASVGENFDNKNKGLLAGVDISFSGAPSNANQWRVDGANNNDVGSQRTILIYPSIDGIEEFKILRNSYGPEYGGAGGAQVNIVTKGGGNQFHGDAYYFGRNDILNAKNFFLGINGPCAAGDPTCAKQKLRRNDFGYTIGGPVKKDKIFFFWSEEWNYERRGAVRQSWVPSAQDLKGNWTDVAACPGGSKGAALPAFPAGTTTAPNVLNPANLSPAGSAYLSQLPLPNSSVCNQYDWVAQVGVPLNWREENIRGDVNITKNTALVMRYTQDAWDNPQHAYGEGGLWGDQAWPAVSDAWTQPGKMAVGKLTTTLGSSTVNDFSFSWSANRINITQAGDNPALAKTIAAAMPTIYPNSDKLHAGNLPIPICWCSTYFGIIGPWQNRQDLFTWKDDFSKVRGAHTFKLGVLYSRNAKDEEGGDEAGGIWGATGYKSNWTGTTNNLFSDLQLKDMLFGINENQRNIISPLRWRDTEFYFGDSWKVARTLTVDYGFRWSFMPYEYLQDNHYANFLPSAYSAALGSDPCNGIVMAKGATNQCQALGFKGGTIGSDRSIAPSNQHLVAPRLGFAWDVFGKQTFVIRGGVGQFFSRDPVGTAIRMEQSNPPFGLGAGGERTLDRSPGSSSFVTGVNLFDFAVAGTPSQSVEHNTNVANSWQWNLTTEVALGQKSKLELGWVALRGIHLAAPADINQIRPADRLPYLQRQIRAAVSGASDPAVDLFPFGALTHAQVTQWTHRGDSIYHSLQAMYSAKFTHNSVFQTSYTWSKNIATTTLSYGGTAQALGDTYNQRANRGLADFDRRHVFNASLVYNLPTLENSNGFVKNFAGGWELTSVLNFATGPQLNASGLGLSNITIPTGTYGCTTAGGCVISLGSPWGTGNSSGFAARPNRDFSQPCRGPNHLQWINPAAFTVNGFVLGQDSNTGPNQCTGPGIGDADMGLDKNWVLPFHGNKYFGEKSRLQFRFEAFNLANHPMFRFNGNNLNWTVQGGSIVNNTIQGAKLVTGSRFGQSPLASNIGNREIQYSIKLIF